MSRPETERRGTDSASGSTGRCCSNAFPAAAAAAGSTGSGDAELSLLEPEASESAAAARFGEGAGDAELDDEADGDAARFAGVAALLLLLLAISGAILRLCLWL